MSKKASHAENQQERLVMIGWVVGFVDGEGCFTINFAKQPDREEKSRIRKGYKIGFQIGHEFAVTQGVSSIDCLKNLQKFFGVGSLYINKRYDNHKEHLYRYCVRRREDLINVIIPFFRKYNLKTAKMKNFQLFDRCMEEIQKGNHLTNNGAIKIAQLSEKMNHKKSKSDIIRILRNQTSGRAKAR